MLLPLAAAGAVAGGLIPRVCIDNAATHTPAIDDAAADNAVAGAERLDEAVFAPRWKLKGAVYPMGRGEVGVSAADCRAVPEDRAAAPAQHLEPPAVRLGDPAPWLNTDEATAPLGLHREQQAPEPAVAGRVAGARPPERCLRPVPLPPDGPVWVQKTRQPAVADGAGRVGGARPPERCLRPVPLPPDGPVWVRETRQPAVADGAGRVGGARPSERWLRPVPLLADGLDRAPLAPKRRRSCWGRRCGSRGGCDRVRLAPEPVAAGGRAGRWRSWALTAPGDGEHGAATSGVIACSRWVGFSGGGRAGPVAATAVCAGKSGPGAAAPATALALEASRRPGLPVDSGGSAHAGAADRDPGRAGTAAGAVCSAQLGGVVVSAAAAGAVCSAQLGGVVVSAAAAGDGVLSGAPGRRAGVSLRELVGRAAAGDAFVDIGAVLGGPAGDRAGAGSAASSTRATSPAPPSRRRPTGTRAGRAPRRGGQLRRRRDSGIVPLRSMRCTSGACRRIPSAQRSWGRFSYRARRGAEPTAGEDTTPGSPFTNPDGSRNPEQGGVRC